MGGAELHKRLSYLEKGSLSYLRTKSGAEVDFIITLDGESKTGRSGFISCRCPHPVKIDENITAIPWNMM